MARAERGPRKRERGKGKGDCGLGISDCGVGGLRSGTIRTPHSALRNLEGPGAARGGVARVGRAGRRAGPSDGSGGAGALRVAGGAVGALGSRVCADDAALFWLWFLVSLVRRLRLGA